MKKTGINRFNKFLLSAIKLNKRKTEEKKNRFLIILSNTKSIITSFFVIFLVVVFTIFFIKQLDTAAIEIGTISVPSNLEKEGYTPKVISHIIKDEFNLINHMVNTQAEKKYLKPDWLVKDIELSILNSDIPYEVFQKTIHSVLGIETKQISGDIVLTDKDSIKITLRALGKVRIVEGNIGDIKEIIGEATKEIYKIIDPYIMSVYSIDENLGVTSVGLIKELLRNDDPNDDKWAWNHWGTILMDKNYHSKAINKFENAIEADKDFFLPYYNLGLLYFKDEKIDSAYHYYKYALDLNDSFERTYIGISEIFYQKKEYAKAQDVLKQLYKINNVNPYYYKIQSAISLAEGDTIAAFKNIQEALRYDPENALFNSLQGGLYLLKGEFKKALLNYKDAFRFSKNLSAKIDNAKFISYCIDTLQYKDLWKAKHKKVIDSLVNKSVIEKLTESIILESLMEF